MVNLLRKILVLPFAFTCACAFSKTFCVATSVEFADALSESSTNGDDDLIKLTAGAYSPLSEYGFIASISDDRALAISGGFSSGVDGTACATLTRNAYLTILDGSASKALLRIDSSAASSASVSVNNLTVQGVPQGGYVVRIASSGGWSGDVVMENVSIRDNQTAEPTLLLSTRGRAVIRNTEIVRNTNTGNGFGSVVQIIAGNSTISGPSIIFNNNTIADNVIDDVEINVALLSQGGEVRVGNNVLWNISGIDLYVAGDLYLSHNDIGSFQGSVPMEEIGAFHTPPHFLSADSYRLSVSSPLRNAGTNSFVVSGAADIEGMPRIGEATVDIGAHEFTDVIFANGVD